MKNIPGISVIVPLYNVEDYVEKSINSILNQTYKDFELIIVDDGSTDSSFEICKRIQKTTSGEKIRLFAKQNEGLYSARNMGLKFAKGEYVYFMDSDDWIEENLLEDNYKLARKHKADIVLFGYRKVTFKDRNFQFHDVPFPLEGRINGINDDNFYSVINSGHGFAVWQQLIRKEIITNSNISFPSMKRGADMAFLLDLYPHSNLIYINNKSYYNYLLLASSKKFDFSVLENHIKIYKKIFEKYNYKSEAANAFKIKLFVLWFVYVIPNSIIRNENFTRKEKIDRIKEIFMNNDLNKFSSSLKYSEGSSTNAVMLLIFKMKSPLGLYYLIKISNLFSKNSLLYLKKIF